MFKFNFCSENSPEETLNSSEKHDEQIAQCSEIAVGSGTKHQNFKPISIENVTFEICDLENLIKSENSSFLDSYKNCDVIPNIYEGGLKVWECTYDLLTFLSRDGVDFFSKTVLDLGCGCGLLGIYAASKNAECVHFQDFNAEVLKNFTIPNVVRNKVRSKTQFFSGDWNSFSTYSSAQVYDYILCSELLYNANSYPKLGNLFDEKLRTGGKVIMASKSYYFGVGGSVQQFKEFLKETVSLSCQTVWKTSEGVQREILIIEKLDTDECIKP